MYANLFLTHRYPHELYFLADGWQVHKEERKGNRLETAGHKRK